jgi:hypothetical protein
MLCKVCQNLDLNVQNVSGSRVQCRHHADIAPLKVSAIEGCELCHLLFNFGTPRGLVASSRVFLFFDRPTTKPTSLYDLVFDRKPRPFDSSVLKLPINFQLDFETWGSPLSFQDFSIVELPGESTSSHLLD